MKIVISIRGLLALLVLGSANLMAQSNPFPDKSIPAFKYQGSMTITAQVVKNGEVVTDADVAVYCGDDFRGEDEVGNDPTHPNLVYLTSYGDYTGNHQYLHFKVNTGGHIFTCVPTPALDYTMHGIVGKTSEPYIIDISPVSLANNADNTETLTAWKDKTCDVELTDRSLTKAGSWNTLCLPFSMTAEQIAASDFSDAVIKELDNSSSGTSLAADGTLTLKFITATSIEAGKPYIVRWNGSNGLVNPVVFCSVNLTSTTPTAVASYDGTVTFVGTYSPALLPRNVKTNLYMGAGNTLYYPNVDNFYVNACRSYFQLNPSVAAEVRAFVFDFEEDDADALSEYSEYSDYSDNKKGIYDLSGRCIANGQKPTVKGLYIVNGKKIMVR
jgi:hypothetical protein